jgi:NarL family two-component system response regulator LiaR
LASARPWPSLGLRATSICCLADYIPGAESAPHPPVATKLIEEIKHLSALPPSAGPLTNREIALELSISVRTVSNHVRSILDKLHLANRTQAALYAVEQGIVSRA